MKKTEWFKGSEKPVRVGVYERDYDVQRTYYCYWTGKVFNGGYHTAYRAVNAAPSYESPYQDLPWRGLTEESK